MCAFQAGRHKQGCEGKDLHERLALESMKVSESLNTYVVKSLKKELGLL